MNVGELAKLFNSKFGIGGNLPVKVKFIQITWCHLPFDIVYSTFSKHANVLSYVIKIHITDRNAYKLFETGLYIVKTIHDMYPNDFHFRDPSAAGVSFFDNLVGNGFIRADIEAGKSVEEMEAAWQTGLNEFNEIREKYLLY